jgi:putative endopeptidase
MRLLTVSVLCLTLVAAAPAQTSAPASPSSMPELDHFSPDQADKSLNPCSDFFEYACSKWIKANPMPADQAGWGTLSLLGIWNVAAIQNTLEYAANKTSGRTAVEQKVGDYYASCMDEAAVIA